MHLLLPFAAARSPAAAQAIAQLKLPTLQRLLARWGADPAGLVGAADAGPDPETMLSMPHERALAAALGWPAAADGLLPLAAHAARADGLSPTPGSGWALLTPTHWRAGADQVTLVGPAELALPDDHARTLCDALRPVFADIGLDLQWGAASRWYLVGDTLATLPTASLDRVVGGAVDRWLNRLPAGRALRSRQAEAQMLLHDHPLNAAREDAGLLPVNSVWISGTGAAPPAPLSSTPAAAAAATVQVDQRLRDTALADDWPAWLAAWQAIDAGPLAALLAAEHVPGCALTLCGERHALRLAPRRRTLAQRWFGGRATPLAALLEAL